MLCVGIYSGFDLGEWCFPFLFPLCGYGMDETLHSGGTVFLHLVGDVAVNVEGEGCGGVAEVLLHGLDVIARLDGGHGVGMAQVMESGVGRADGGYNAFEFPVGVLGFQVAAQLIGEDEACFMPAFAVTEAVFQLAVAFVFEGCQDGGGKGDGAAFAVFGGNHLVFAFALSNVLELLVYPDVPPDVYRRHERCRCTVLYDPADGKRKRQNVHTKKWTDSQERDRIETRKNTGIKSLVQELSEHPKRLASFTPESLYDTLTAEGLEVKPLMNGSLKGIPFSDGGGFKVNFEDGGLLQFHPEKGSHHGGAYYKISTGKKGLRRYDLEGNEDPNRGKS